MGQDSFIHETTDGRINNPQGQNLTVFRRDGIARNPIDLTAPFNVKHPDGYIEPIAAAGAGGNFNYSVEITGVGQPGGAGIDLTATPSVGLVADYTYDWSLHSLNMTGTSVDPTLGVAVDNEIEATNGNVLPAEGMIKVVSTHIATGAIAENYFWVGLAGVPA